MSDSALRLKGELAQLPPRDRAALAHFLIGTLDEETDDDYDVAWQAELDRRAAEIRSGQPCGEPATKVFADLRQKHS